MKLAKQINQLKKSKTNTKIRSRVRELKTNKNLFSELCFCLTTANSTARAGLKAQEKPKKFVELNQRELAKYLKKCNVRFHNNKAKYIILARRNKKKLPKIISLPPQEARKWLTDNILGLGFKEASHFLRNVGVMDVAILDRHVLRAMKREGIIREVPKSITPKKYLEFENALQPLARETNLPLGVLDFYLWFMETGEVLK